MCASCVAPCGLQSVIVLNLLARVPKAAPSSWPAAALRLRRPALHGAGRHREPLKIRMPGTHTVLSCQPHICTCDNSRKSVVRVGRGRDGKVRAACQVLHPPQKWHPRILKHVLQTCSFVQSADMSRVRMQPAMCRVLTFSRGLSSTPSRAREFDNRQLFTSRDSLVRLSASDNKAWALDDLYGRVVMIVSRATCHVTHTCCITVTVRALNTRFS